MMRHLLMNPNFPDIVSEWAEELNPEELDERNGEPEADQGEPLESFLSLARAEIARSRIW
jgi:hypothetical protein